MTISRKYVSTPERQPMTDWQRDRMHPATTHESSWARWGLPIIVLASIMLWTLVGLLIEGALR